MSKGKIKRNNLKGEGLKLVASYFWHYKAAQSSNERRMKDFVVFAKHDIPNYQAHIDVDPRLRKYVFLQCVPTKK